MKLFLSFVLVVFWGCSNSQQIVEKTEKGIYIFKSGNFSGQEYISITQKINREIQFKIFIEVNRYFSGVGKLNYIWMEQYDKKGKYLGVRKFIKDSSMFSKLIYISQSQDVNPIFTKLSDEEYEVIKSALMKYPVITMRYNLNADTFRNYLGWYEDKKFHIEK